MIDKHTNIATALLGQIKARGLDEYYAIEEDLLTGKGDKAAVMGLLAATGRGTPEDKLRLAIIHIMAQTEPMTPADAEALEGALRASGAEASARGGWAQAADRARVATATARRRRGGSAFIRRTGPA